jgi:hypothetical protein
MTDEPSWDVSCVQTQFSVGGGLATTAHAPVGTNHSFRNFPRAATAQPGRGHPYDCT